MHRQWECDPLRTSNRAAAIGDRAFRRLDKRDNIFMRHKGIYKLSLLLLVFTTLAGCTFDPNKRKMKYANSGEEYAEQGKYREATIQFRNALQIDPKFAEGHYQLALAYLRL